MLSGEWRIKQNDELETLFYTPSILETRDYNNLGMLGIAKTHSYS